MDTNALIELILRLPLKASESSSPFTLFGQRLAWEWSRDDDTLHVQFHTSIDAHHTFVCHIHDELDILVTRTLLTERNEKDASERFLRNFNIKSLLGERTRTYPDGYELREFLFRFRDNPLLPIKHYAFSFFACHDPMNRGFLSNGIYRVASAEVKIQGLTRFVSMLIHYEAPKSWSYHEWNHSLKIRLVTFISRLALVVAALTIVGIVFQIWTLLWDGVLSPRVLRWSLWTAVFALGLFVIMGGRIGRTDESRRFSVRNIYRLPRLVQSSNQQDANS